MVKPHWLARAGMYADGAPDLRGLEAVVVLPLIFDIVTPAVSLNRCLVSSLKRGLPTDTKPGTKVADIHVTPAPERIDNPRMDAMQNLSCVSNRRFASGSRRHTTEEEDLEGKRS